MQGAEGKEVSTQIPGNTGHSATGRLVCIVEKPSTLWGGGYPTLTCLWQHTSLSSQSD